MKGRKGARLTGELESSDDASDGIARAWAAGWGDLALGVRDHLRAEFQEGEGASTWGGGAGGMRGMVLVREWW